MRYCQTSRIPHITSSGNGRVKYSSLIVIRTSDRSLVRALLQFYKVTTALFVLTTTVHSSIASITKNILSRIFAL